MLINLWTSSQLLLICTTQAISNNSLCKQSATFLNREGTPHSQKPSVTVFFFKVFLYLKKQQQSRNNNNSSLGFSYLRISSWQTETMELQNQLEGFLLRTILIDIPGIIFNLCQEFIGNYCARNLVEIKDLFHTICKLVRIMTIIY